MKKIYKVIRIDCNFWYRGGTRHFDTPPSRRQYDHSFPGPQIRHYETNPSLRHVTSTFLHVDTSHRHARLTHQFDKNMGTGRKDKFLSKVLPTQNKPPYAFIKLDVRGSKGGFFKIWLFSTYIWKVVWLVGPRPVDLYLE